MPTTAPRESDVERFVASDDLVFHAKQWILDCTWRENEYGDEEAFAKEIAMLPKYTLARRIHRHYDGGLPAFMENTTCTS